MRNAALVGETATLLIILLKFELKLQDVLALRFVEDQISIGVVLMFRKIRLKPVNMLVL